MSPFIRTILITLAIVLAPAVLIGIGGAIGTLSGHRPHRMTPAEAAVEAARERGSLRRAELRRFYRPLLRSGR